jgi:hypothetical protein
MQIGFWFFLNQEDDVWVGDCEQVVVRFCKVQIVVDGKENLLLNPTM